MRLPPHIHQSKAVDATFEYWSNNSGIGLVVAPVAAGKSLIIAEIIKRACQEYPETNCLVLADVSRLLLQNEKRLKGQWPEASTSFFAAKLKQKSFRGQTIFASIQSIYKKAYKIPKTIDLIFIDEAHTISPNEATMYRAFIKDMLLINPDVRIVGLTGTPFRATDGRLTEGEGHLFTDIIYQIPMLYLIEKGFLCPLVTPPVQTKMSTAGIGTRNGDYIESQLQAAVDKDAITKACISEAVQLGAQRYKWLVFTAGIKHCEHVAEELRKHGISCETLTSANDDHEEEVYQRFDRGDFQCLVTVGKATKGVDIPAIDLILFMRPSRSEVLYVQMGGRGMRLFPGKTDCMLLDFGGVVDELGPIDLVDAKRVDMGSGDGEAPIKICPKCHAVCFAGVRHCQDCNYEFPVREHLNKTASTKAVMSNQIEPEWFTVLSVSHKLHAKEGKIPSMCVTYNTLNGPIREWVCYEHTGFAREKASKWHNRFASTPLPKKVSEALQCQFRKPNKILARKTGKFYEIVSYDFE